MVTQNFPYTLAAIDIDDTLVGPDKKIGRENRLAVQTLRDLGCRVILASGRRHANMLAYCDELGIDDYVVSCHGARVEHQTTGDVLRQALIGADDAASLVAEGLSLGHTVLLWLPSGIFAQAESQWTAEYCEDTGGDFVSITDLQSLSHQPAEKVIWAASPAEIAIAFPSMSTRYAGRVAMTITHDWYLEMTAPEAHKAEGVAAVAATAGIPREAVLAFGDGNNDVSLLSWAGFGVAMPHGRAAAHAAADMVAPHGNPESALSRAINQITKGFSNLAPIPG